MNLREVLEQCLAEDASPEVLAEYMPSVKKVRGPDWIAFRVIQHAAGFHQSPERLARSTRHVERERIWRQ